MSTVQISKWNIKADYVETCNCDYGCPCNFNGFPTYGFCRAIVLYHIKSGSFGSTKLDDIDVVYVGSWPKAIHEGNGTMQLFISKKAMEDQRNAIVNIFMGKVKGEGPFAVFAGTVKDVHSFQSSSTKVPSQTAPGSSALALLGLPPRLW